MMKKLFTLPTAFTLCLLMFLRTSGTNAGLSEDWAPGIMLVQLTGRPSSVNVVETDTTLFVEFDLQGIDLLARCRASGADASRLRQAAKEIEDVTERLAEATSDTDTFWRVMVYGEYNPQLDLLELEWARVPWEIELETGEMFRAYTRYEFSPEASASDLAQVYSRVSTISTPEPAIAPCVDVVYNPAFEMALTSCGRRYSPYRKPPFRPSVTCPY